MNTVKLYIVEHKFGKDLLTRKSVIAYVNTCIEEIPVKAPKNLKNWELVEWYFAKQNLYELGEYLDEYELSSEEILEEILSSEQLDFMGWANKKFKDRIRWK